MIDRIAGEGMQRASLPNGPGAAILLSGGIGAFVLAVLAIVADHSLTFKKLMIFYTPTGALSGVTTTAITVWLVSWIVLAAAWKRRQVLPWWIDVAFGLVAISFLLMFPPVGDLF
jgi:hypothetical protein